MSEKANAIEKTLEILASFSPHNQPVGTSELSKKLGYHKATTSRILLTLAEKEFVHQDAVTKKFSLGAKIYELGMIFGDTSVNKIIQISRPYVDSLRDKINETVTLEVWTGNSTVSAYGAESDRPLKVSGRLGKIPPVHVAAGARAILSVSDEATVDSILRGTFEKYTENTVIDPVVLKENLKIYNARGFATDLDELDVGISGIAAPIFDHRGQAIAAVVVLTPTPRFTDDPDSETIAALKKTTASISGKFLFKGD